MVSQLGDLQDLAVDSIDHAVFRVNPARPEARKGVFQRFRFANAFMVVPHRVLDEVVDFSNDFFIHLLPVQVVVPCLRGEKQVHARSSSETIFRIPFP